MAKFIKLSQSGGWPLIFDAERILGAVRMTAHQTRLLDVDGRYENILVTETPDEILALIKHASAVEEAS